MERPTITINGNVIPMKTLTGRDWRKFAEFLSTDVKSNQLDYVEQHAKFLANFFEGVTDEDILDLPLEEIFPLYVAVQKFIASSITLGLKSKIAATAAMAQSA